VYTSSNGSSWQPAGSLHHPAAATSLASGTPGQLVLATTGGIYQSSNSGTAWRPANLAGGGPAGGFSYVGMTNGTNGVAVPTNQALGMIYVTTDGGLHWRQSPITG